MTRRLVLSGTFAIAALGAGCQSSTHQRFSTNPTQNEQPKVTVRFVNQPGLEFACGCNNQNYQLACQCDQCDTPWLFGNLFSGNLFSCNQSPCNHDCQWNQTVENNSQYSTESVNLCSMGGLADGPDSMPQHAVLWGGGYNGHNVTSCPTSLDPGSYTFAYFDPDRGAAYQGWIAINSGGDDILSALTEWRNTVHTQEEWLAFENKINGKYTSHDPSDFNRFKTELTNLRRLEGKINAAIYSEQKDRKQMSEWRSNYLGNAQIVLMPGNGSNFLTQPATMPAFQPTDLSAVQGGQPVTKVILAGDFARSMEKLDRLADLQNEMRRCRTVLNEEIVRLENRRSYFRLTSHLYNHDFNFMGNEQRVQKAQGVLSKLDRQITENRRHGHAILAVVGLFAPEEANHAFDVEQTQIRGERAVWAERLLQVEMQFNDASNWSEKRIALERQRQYFLAQLEECDAQLDQCEQAADTVAQLRQNTGVIYRNGPASILAASFVTDSVPARLADAIEKESMMTIRLHSAEGVRPSPKHLTEGEAFGEHVFMLTSDRPGYSQPNSYGKNGSQMGQPNLSDWSKTQQNHGQWDNNPSDCGQSQYQQP